MKQSAAWRPPHLRQWIRVTVILLCLLQPCSSATASSHLERVKRSPCLFNEYDDEDLGCQPCSRLCDPGRGTGLDCERLCGEPGPGLGPEPGPATPTTTTQLETKLPISDDVTAPTYVPPFRALGHTRDDIETSQSTSMIILVACFVGLGIIVAIATGILLARRRRPNRAADNISDTRSDSQPTKEVSPNSKSALCIRNHIYSSPITDPVTTTTPEVIVHLLPADNYRNMQV